MIFSRNLRIWAILRFDKKFVQRFLQKYFNNFIIIIITSLLIHYSLSLKFSLFL